MNKTVPISDDRGRHVKHFRTVWALAKLVRADPVAAKAVRETLPGQLAQDYREEKLPPTLQQGLANFLRTYGHRGVAEIDLGLPRWSEDRRICSTSTADALLRGTPASAGRVTAQARMILEPTGARLSPGEILVAPSTDPGWTPLFLTASGLVMEMGGAMSHGAVVAREYGIPAVAGALQRLAERLSQKIEWGYEGIFTRFERTGASRSRRRKTTSADHRTLRGSREQPSNAT